MQRQTHKSRGPKGQAAACLKHFKVAGRFSARQIKANASHNAEMIRKARVSERGLFSKQRGKSAKERALSENKSAEAKRTSAAFRQASCGRLMFRRFSDSAFDVLPFREKTEGSLKKDRIPFLSRLC